MNQQENKRVSIFGAGLVGSLFAILLARRGYKVDVFERRTDMRRIVADRGRSINLALSERGWRALDLIGLTEEIKAQAIAMSGRMVHDLAGKLSFFPYGETGQAIYSVSRARFNAAMLSYAEAYPQITFHFNKRCMDVNFDTTTAFIEDTITGEVLEVKSNIIVGADGAFSAVRGAMQKTDRFDYSQRYIEHGYKELTIPPSADGNFRIDKNALHIWPRKQYMLIALPNPDKSFTCTLFFPMVGQPSFASLTTPEEVRAFFTEVFPDALPLIPDLEKDFFANTTSSLVTVKCKPFYKKNVFLIGDAAHAILPFYGQGMNAGFEDCVVLEELLNEYHDDWDTVLYQYNQSRKPNADAIAELAVDNFIEMRDLVGQPHFQLRKKIESAIHHAMPDKWIPRYSLVTFTNTPYKDALAIGKKQDIILDTLMQRDDIQNLIEDKSALALAVNMLSI